MAIIGSEAWQVNKDADFDAKAHLKGYLRYALALDSGLSQIVVRKGAGDFEIDSRILSRTEVYWAWRKLKRDWRVAIWLRLVGGMGPVEAGRVMGVSERSIRYYVEFGLDAMLERIYEFIESEQADCRY